MNKTEKKIIICVMALLLCTGIFAGCAGNSNDLATESEVESSVSSAVDEENRTIAPVTQLKSVAKGSVVTLSWAASKDADAYILYQYNSKTKKWDEIGETNKTQYTIKKVEPGTYKYGIVAVQADQGDRFDSDRVEIAVKVAKDGKETTVKATEKSEDSTVTETSSTASTTSTKPSSGNTTTTTNPSGGFSGGSSAPTKPSGSSSGASAASVTPVHTHTWVQQYTTKTVKHPAEYETVTEPVYDYVERTICNGCGADITGDGGAHTEAAALAGNKACRSYSIKWIQVQTGTTTEKVLTKAAWTETVKVPNGYRCSGCGATK